MESYIDYAKKMGEDPTELTIVKHYAMKFMTKQKWTNMVRNRAKWEKGGVNDSFYNAIIAQHYHFIGDDDPDVFNGDPNAKISKKRHNRAMRDYWDDEVDELNQEIEDLRDDVIPQKEHKDIIRKTEKEHERVQDAMDYEIRKLKSQLDFAKDKAEARDKVHESQLAFREKTEQAMEKAHESALKAAMS